jgi:5-methyltetrahydropteroyltriglutamate--homocysteine methyltransferase
MSALTSRTDVVGSLLRPADLLQARQEFSAGRLTPAQFKRIEDQAVDQAVALQEAAGLDVATDGEMRRLSFQSQLPEAVEGFGEWDLDAFLWGDWYGDASVGESHRERPARLGVTGKLRRRRSLCSEEFTYLRARTTRIPKVTLPSPSLWANFWSPELSATVYPTLDAFLADVVQILREEVEELAGLGATYIQLDAPHYPLLLDPRTRAFYESRGWTVDRWLSEGIALDNAVMAGFPNVTFGLHVCRGNQGSRWLVEGDYEMIAKPIFRETAANRLLLEYDDARSGSFDALRFVPEDKVVVLGLVSTKHDRVEPVAQLTQRIGEASRFVPLERLAMSPQCGFASSIIGNALSPAAQAAKLRAVVETARMVWPSP